MEKAILKAVWNMGCESLDPDMFQALEERIQDLYQIRNLGDCDLTEYKI